MSTDSAAIVAFKEDGEPGRNRTCDPLLRRQMLYPTELRALEDDCSSAEEKTAERRPVHVWHTPRLHSRSRLRASYRNELPATWLAANRMSLKTFALIRG